MRRVIAIFGAGILVSAAMRQQLEEGGYKVIVNGDPLPDDRTLTLTERLAMGDAAFPVIQVDRPPAPPPWHNDQPWLKRKKKGRS